MSHDRPSPHSPLRELVLVALVFAGARTALRAAGVDYAGSGAVIASLVLVAWFQYRRGASLRSLGLMRPTRPGRAAWLTLVALALTVLIGAIVLTWLRDLFGVSVPVQAELELGARLLRVVVIGWLAAALGEELLMRGFLLGRLLELLPAGRIGAMVAIAAMAIVFGALHYTQGWPGVIAAGLIGAVYGSIVVRANGNLWPVILAHAVPDTISLLQAH